MDTLTHALSGALIARATAPREGRPHQLPPGRRMLVGFLACAFPDSDVVLSYFSPLAYILYHRGLTHSLIMLPVWSFLLARLCAVLWRNGPGWRTYFGVIAWAIGLHIAGDWITSFGTMVFAPLSDWRAALSTTFIIDPWFSAILVAALIAVALWPRSRVPAVAGFVVLCSYVAMQYAIQREAVRFGEAYARAAGIEGAAVSVQPRPVSPFNWMVIIDDGARYRYALVNFAREEPMRLKPDAGFAARLSAPYLPADQAQWVTVDRFGPDAQAASLAKDVFQSPQFAFYRWFARYPALYRIEQQGRATCVWFEDLRFFIPGRAGVPFLYGLCAEPNGPWRVYQRERGLRFPVH